MEREDVPARAEASGARLRAALEAMPEVAAVRGWGLLLAAELGESASAAQVAHLALEAGVVVNAVSPTALRFAPSLLIEDDLLDEALGVLAEVLARVAAEHGGDEGVG